MKKKPVDKNRLMEAVQKRGMSIYDAGIKCEKSKHFIRNFHDREEVPVNDIPIIEKFLGIQYSEYCPVDKTDKISKKQDTYVDIDFIIKRAKEENIEIELEITPEAQRITARPFVPFSYICPYSCK